MPSILFPVSFASVLAAATLVNLAGNFLGNRGMVVFSKPLLVPPILALYLGLSGHDGWKVPVALALLLGWAGDVLFLWRRTSSGAAVAGIAAFMGGNAAYISAMLPGIEPGLLLLPIIIPFAAFAFMLYRRLQPGLGSYKVPVAGYMAVIITMGIASAARFASSPGTGTFVTACGAVMFIASDSLLSIETFREKRRLLRHVPVMALYVMGQLLMAIGFAI